jgi:hypothetical protein
MTKNDIIDLLVNDEVSNAIKALRAALPSDNTILNLAGQWNRLQKEKGGGLVSNEYATMTGNIIRNSLIELTKRLPDDLTVDVVLDTSPPSPTPNPKKNGPVVFLSYNHEDSAYALKVRDFLRAKGIQITIDSEAMLAGDNIQSFIQKSIEAADITLSLVSTKSLLSAWVGMESMNTLVGSKIAGKKLIAVVIDKSFYGNSFVVTAVKSIDAKLKQFDKDIDERRELGIGWEDIQNEITRERDLRNGLVKIIANLKENFNIDISEEKFELGMEKVAQSILNQ